MKKLFLLVLLSSSLLTNAQGWLPQGARSAGLGGSSVTLVDAFAFHHNPGALGFLEEGTAGVSYETRFLLRELQSQSIAVAQPLKTGVISVGGQFYGFETFRTNRIGVGYSMKLTDNLATGVQMNYLSLRLDPFYGVKHSVTGEAGMLATLGDDLTFGFSVVNLGRARLSEFQDDRFSTVMRLGASYKLMEELLFVIELEQEVTYDTRLRAGLEYNPTDRFYFRCGVQGAPMDFSFGTGFKFGNLKLDLATYYNQILGWTPGASLIYNFKKKNNE